MIHSNSSRYIGSLAEMRELLELAGQKEKDIKGGIKTLPARQLSDALRMVADGSRDFRIVVEM